jgi:hypothetical protein
MKPVLHVVTKERLFQTHETKCEDPKEERGFGKKQRGHAYLRQRFRDSFSGWHCDVTGSGQLGPFVFGLLQSIPFLFRTVRGTSV